MTKNSENYKRNYPKFGPCCFCCSKRTSALTSTAILLILEVVGTIYDLASSQYSTLISYNTIVKVLTYITLGFSIIIAISYILLLFGFSNRKSFCLNQFKIIYLIYLIYCIGNSIYQIILFYDNKYVEYYVKTILEEQKESFKTFEINEYSFMSENEIRRSFETGRVYGIFAAIVSFIILIIYYLATCSYIEDLEEEAFEEKQSRNLENN